MEKHTMGQFIAALRRANGLTQQDLADKLSVSNKAVSRWERDECAPDITLLPAIAEIFGITCDELLRGERKSQEDTAPQSEYRQSKSEKQIKALLSREGSRFKTVCIIALALAVVGYLCLIGISYGFYRPMIGFAVMMLFLVAAVTVMLVGMNKMREVLESELCEAAEPSQLLSFRKEMGEGAFHVCFACFGGLVLSVPFLLSMMTFSFAVPAGSFYLGSFLLSAGLLVCLYLYARKPLTARLGGLPYEKAPKSYRKALLEMNLLQIGAAVGAALCWIYAPYFYWNEYSNKTPYIDYVLIALGFLLCAADLVVLAVCLRKNKEHRRYLTLSGIRNSLLIVPAVVCAFAHSTSWSYGDGHPAGGALVDYWSPGFLLFAVVLTAVIFIVFGVLIYKRNMGTCACVTS